MSKEIRDSKGRYLPGGPGGPGRMPRSIEQEYLSIFYTKCTPARWGNVCGKAVDQAENGDRYARDWLSRIIVPALERIIIASLNVNMDVQLDESQVSELIGMLVGGQDASAIGDVIDGQVVDSE